MSAGTELDKGAIARGLLVPKQRTARADEPSEPRYPNEMRSQYPLAVLSRDHDAVCTHAVDPAEIAATLEAAGLNDRLVRERYRMGNIFELSRQLFELVPRRAVAGPAASDPWHLPLSRHLVRGALYALPMLPYVVLLRLVRPSTAVIVTLLVGNVVSMAFTQAASHLAHVLKGFGSPASAARVLRIALLFAAVSAMLFDVIAIATRALPVGAMMIAGGQLVYVAAATTLLVFERDRRLLASVVPVGLVSIATAIVSPWRHGILTVAASALGLVLCVIVGFAWTTIRSELRSAGTPQLRIGVTDVRGVLVHAAYGAVTAGLLMYAVVDGVTTGGPLGDSFAGAGMLPLVLSLGVAEAQLYGFRSDCTAFMRTTSALDAFARRVRIAMTRRGLRYAGVLAALSLGGLTSLWVTGNIDAISVLRHAGYAELGIALLGATVLASCQLVGRAVVVLSFALLADLIAQVMRPDLLVLSLEHVVSFAMVGLIIWWVAAAKLISPFRHR